MKARMIKYTKPYLLLIALSIGLLYAQANFNLTLPDYLSKIVNVGIQQGGVENAVPKAIREIAIDLIKNRPERKIIEAIKPDINVLAAE